jgi:nitrous oxide reductase accessory protein NosL
MLRAIITTMILLTMTLTACGGSEESPSAKPLPSSFATQADADSACGQLQADPPAGKSQVSLDVRGTESDVLCVLPQ